MQVYRRKNFIHWLGRQANIFACLCGLYNTCFCCPCKTSVSTHDALCAYAHDAFMSIFIKKMVFFRKTPPGKFGKIPARPCFPSVTKFSPFLDREKHDLFFCDRRVVQVMAAEKYNAMYHSALNALANDSIRDNQLLWKIRPKFHQLDHLVLDCAPQSNPLRVANYQEEDMVGRMKRLALASHPANLGLSVLERWSWHVALRWRNA